MVESPFPIQLTVGLGAVGPGHPALLAAEDDLLAELKDAAPTAVIFGGPPAPGTKGTAQDLIVNLGGPGTAGGLAVRALRIWLERDRRRSVKLVRRDGAGDVVAEAEVTGENISRETLNKALGKIGWMGPEGD